MIKPENAYLITQFSQQVCQNFNNRADTLMDLVDALSNNCRAQSVVGLSLNPCFCRGYTSQFTTIAEYEPQKPGQCLAQLVAAYLPQPARRPFWLFGVDVTPQPRTYVSRLRDRSHVYQSNLIRSNKPGLIGHQYSEVLSHPQTVLSRFCLLKRPNLQIKYYIAHQRFFNRRTGLP